MGMQSLRRLAPRWLPRLLAVWVLGLATATVDACLESPADPVENAQTALTHAHDEPHAHELTHCNDTVDHQATVAARPSDSGKDPRTPLALPPAALTLSAAPPRRTLGFAQADEPAPLPTSLYLRTARLRI